MTRNIILTYLFITPAEPDRFASSVVAPQAIKWAVTPTQPTYSHMISHHLPASFPTAKKKEEIEKQI
jgi:hypothetical protein